VGRGSVGGERTHPSAHTPGGDGQSSSYSPAAMGWPPRAGESLPKAAEARCEQVKLVDWVLATRGHGAEWERVFLVNRDDWERVWEAIAATAPGAQIKTIRDRGADGVVCGVEVEVTIGKRTALVTVSWHYEDAEAAPRLATAYPTP
jgi:hypothetical protein